MAFGTQPEGATFYAVDHQRKFEFTAWAPLPPPGDDLCRALIGKSESQFVQAILRGYYNDMFEGTRCGGVNG